MQMDIARPIPVADAAGVKGEAQRSVRILRALDTVASSEGFVATALHGGAFGAVAQQVAGALSSQWPLSAVSKHVRLLAPRLCVDGVGEEVVQARKCLAASVHRLLKSLPKGAADGEAGAHGCDAAARCFSLLSLSDPESADAQDLRRIAIELAKAAFAGPLPPAMQRAVLRTVHFEGLHGADAVDAVRPAILSRVLTGPRDVAVREKSVPEDAILQALLVIQSTAAAPAWLPDPAVDRAVSLSVLAALNGAATLGPAVGPTELFHVTASLPVPPAASPLPVAKAVMLLSEIRKATKPGTQASDRVATVFPCTTAVLLGSIACALKDQLGAKRHAPRTWRGLRMTAQVLDLSFHPGLRVPPVHEKLADVACRSVARLIADETAARNRTWEERLTACVHVSRLCPLAPEAAAFIWKIADAEYPHAGCIGRVAELLASVHPVTLAHGGKALRLWLQVFDEVLEAGVRNADGDPATFITDLCQVIGSVPDAALRDDAAFAERLAEGILRSAGGIKELPLRRAARLVGAVHDALARLGRGADAALLRGPLDMLQAVPRWADLSIEVQYDVAETLAARPVVWQAFLAGAAKPSPLMEELAGSFVV
jgi:hypothetical protein